MSNYEVIQHLAFQMAYLGAGAVLVLMGSGKHEYREDFPEGCELWTECNCGLERRTEPNL